MGPENGAAQLSPSAKAERNGLVKGDRMQDIKHLWLQKLGFNHIEIGDVFDNWMVTERDRNTKKITLTQVVETEGLYAPGNAWKKEAKMTEEELQKIKEELEAQFEAQDKDKLIRDLGLRPDRIDERKGKK